MTQLNTEYIYRINKAFDYIESNFNKSMTLVELADVANFSKFHFNRIFHSIVGESPFQFIIRIRLEKAASLIISNKNEPIAEIAFQCGFSDTAMFSRYFKNYFQISASQYRKAYLHNSNIIQQNSNIVQKDDNSLHYFCIGLSAINWRKEMDLIKNVEVKVLPAMTLAYIRNIGPYNGDQALFQKLRNKLFAWAGARGLFGSESTNFLVLYHDDPNVALSDNLRMSLCLTVDPETKVEGEIGKMQIEQAKYAIAHFELSGDEFQTAWNWLYGQWLPNSGYQPDTKPYFEMYHSEPQDGKYNIDFCIPIKPI